MGDVVKSETDTGTGAGAARPSHAGKKRRANSKGRKKHRARKVLLVVLIVIAALVLVSVASCKIMSIPGDPVSVQFDDAAEKAKAASAKGAPLDAQDALQAPEGEIYQSIGSYGWSQTGDAYDEVDDTSWYESDQVPAYSGTDANELMGSCYAMCHRKGSLASYSAPYDEARATIQRMSDDYGCNLTDEQVEALTQLFVDE